MNFPVVQNTNYSDITIQSDFKEARDVIQQEGIKYMHQMEMADAPNAEIQTMIDFIVCCDKIIRTNNIVSHIFRSNVQLTD